MRNVVLAAFLGICLVTGLTVFETTEKTSEKRAAIRQAVREEKAARVAIVGDIMLGREVGALMDKNGYNYPLQKIAAFLRNFDISVGNLEGTALEEYNYRDGFDLKFSFSPMSLGQFVNANFGVVTLANNHSFDYGASGFEETKRHFQEIGLSAVGHPYDINKGIVTTVELKSKKITFIGLNATVPKFDAVKAVELTKKTRLDFPESMLVVMVHWGNEYEKSHNASQEQLARALVDAGAEVVIGHHPHVVQDIGKYGTGIVFYSLGNFVFDQNFSKETRNGLLLGMELAENGASFGLFPITIDRGQPRLMEKSEKEIFLARVAASSSPSLSPQIAKGLIKL